MTNTGGTAIPVGTYPDGIAITPDGKTAYVTNLDSGTVTPISTATNTAGTAIPVDMDPGGIAITPDGRTAYVTNSYNNTVTPISTATNTAGTAIPVGTYPEGIAITPDGRTVYVANAEGNTVTPVSTSTNTAGTAIPVGTSPGGIAITPDGKTAYVTNYYDKTVTPISVAKNTAGTAIPVGTDPYGVAVAPDGKTAYVTNLGSNTVTPIDVATNTTGTAIPAGPQPGEIAITPDQAPTAAFSLAAAPVGSPSSFDGSASSSPVGSIASYQWDFGDGQHATTTTPSTTHVYAAVGTYTARLTVTDTAGTSLAQVFTGQTVSLQGGPQASTTRTITVPPLTLPPLTPPLTVLAPSLTHVGETHSSWREGNRLGTFAEHSRKQPPVGTTFSFVLNESARVSFAFTQRAGGRKVGGRCVAETKQNRHRYSCERTVTKGGLTFIGHAGLSSVAFQGRISASRKLKPGHYTLAITATNAARQNSNTKTLSFSIVS